MPTGIYPRSEAHNKRNSEFRKKNLPKGAFKKGYVPKLESIKKMQLAKKNIPWSETRRKAQEAKKRILLIKSTIVGGKEYSPLWSDIRKIVYKRDGYKCQECGVHCHNEKKINAHHIDYDITHNDLSNLITLCVSCHMKTNYRRENWIVHYITKMENEQKRLICNQ